MTPIDNANISSYISEGANDGEKEMSSLSAFGQSASLTKPLLKDKTFAAEKTFEIKHMGIKLENAGIDGEGNLHTFEYDRVHNPVADPLAFDNDTKKGDFSIKSEERNLNECMKVESCNVNITTDETEEAREIDNSDVPGQEEEIQEIFSLENVQPAIKKGKTGKISSQGRSENHLKIGDVRVVLRRIEMIHADGGIQYVLPSEDTGTIERETYLKESKLSNLETITEKKPKFTERDKKSATLQNKSSQTNRSRPSSGSFRRKKFASLTRISNNLSSQNLLLNKKNRESFEREYSNNSSLQNEVEKSLRNSNANVRFSSNTESESRTKLCEGSKRFQCTQCSKQFKLNYQLKRHLVTHSGEKPYECDFCRKRFSTRVLLRSHIARHVCVTRVTCEVCGKTFANTSNLKQHFRIHTGEKPYKCKLCDKAFSYSEVLSRHTQWHTRSKLYECKVCGKKLASLLNLKNHYLVHSGKKDYQCDVCGMQMRTLRILKFHVRNQHGEDSECHACETCKKEFRTKYYLNKHRLRHSGTVFQCANCGNCFNDKADLKIHIRIHTGERPFKCVVWEKRFTQKPVLDKHMRIHTGEKPFTCEKCGRSFAQKGGLVRHIQSYNGKKLFECELCGKKLSRKFCLDVHMVHVHSGERNFSCDICGKKFASKSNLRSHILVHMKKNLTQFSV